MLNRIIIRLLYLTPIGYILGMLNMLGGDKNSGIKLRLSRVLPVKARSKKLPTFSERLNWLLNGIVLLIQSWYILFNQLAGDLGGSYAFVAIIFALVSIISAIFPKVKWNKGLFK